MCYTLTWEDESIIEYCVTQVDNKYGKMAGDISILQIRKQSLKSYTANKWQRRDSFQIFLTPSLALCIMAAYTTLGPKTPTPPVNNNEHSVSLDSSVDSRHQKGKTERKYLDHDYNS